MNKQKGSQNELICNQTSQINNHMTGRREILHSYKNLDQGFMIELSGVSLEPKGVGSIIIQEGATYKELTDVLYIPKFNGNTLLSAKRLIDQGYEVFLNNNNLMITWNRIVKHTGIFVNNNVRLNLRTIEINFQEEDYPLIENNEDQQSCSISQAENTVLRGFQFNRTNHICIYCKNSSLCQLEHPLQNLKKVPSYCGAIKFDLLGKISTHMADGTKYIMLLTEESTGYRYVKFATVENQLKLKVIEGIIDIERIISKKIIAISTENNPSFLNVFLHEYLNSKAIQHVVTLQKTITDKQLAELKAVFNITKIILELTDLPRKILWNEAFEYVISIINKPTAKTQVDFESKLKLFGRTAIVRIDSQEIGQTPQQMICRFLGSYDGLNPYKFYDEVNIVKLHTKNAVFLPNCVDMSIKDVDLHKEINLLINNQEIEEFLTIEVILNDFEEWLNQESLNQESTRISDIFDPLNNLQLEPLNVPIILETTETKRSIKDTVETYGIILSNFLNGKQTILDSGKPECGEQMKYKVKTLHVFKELKSNSYETKAGWSPAKSLFLETAISQRNPDTSLIIRTQNGENRLTKKNDIRKRENSRYKIVWICLCGINDWNTEQNLMRNEFCSTQIAMGNSHNPNNYYKIVHMAQRRLVTEIVNISLIDLAIYRNKEEKIEYNIPAGYTKFGDRICNSSRESNGLKYALHQIILLSSKPKSELLKSVDIITLKTSMITFMVYFGDGIVVLKSENQTTKPESYKQTSVKAKFEDIRYLLSFDYLKELITTPCPMAALKKVRLTTDTFRNMVGELTELLLISEANNLRFIKQTIRSNFSSNECVHFRWENKSTTSKEMSNITMVFYTVNSKIEFKAFNLKQLVNTLPIDKRENSYNNTLDKTTVNNERNDINAGNVTQQTFFESLNETISPTKTINASNKISQDKNRQNTAKEGYTSKNSRKLVFSTSKNKSWKLKVAYKQILASLTILMFLKTLCEVETFKFQRTQPVIFKNKRNYIYISGSKQINLDVKIVNPCEAYFQNITSIEEENEQLITDCNQLFDKQILKTLKNCPQKQKGQAKRTKRGILAFLILGTVIIGLIIGATVMEQRISENMSTLADNQKQSDQLLNETFKVIDSYLSTIKALTKEEIETRLKLDSLKQEISTHHKIAALIAEYEISFEKLHNTLEEIDESLVTKKPPLKVIHGLRNASDTNFWNNKMFDRSQISNCSYEQIENDLIVNYVITVPIIDENVKIMEARAFNFWNQTSPTNYSWMNYNGPKYIMANLTNDCLLPLDKNWIIDSTVRGIVCDTPGKTIKIDSTMYQSTDCFNCSNKKDYLQIIDHNGLEKIYCYGHNITIEGDELQCPEYVFELPRMVGYKLEGYEYKAVTTNETIVDQIETKIDKVLAKHNHPSEISIKEVNLTTLNTETHTLSNMINKYAPNYSLRNITIPDIVKSPVNYIKRIFESLDDMIQKVLITLLLLTCLLPTMAILTIVTKAIIRLLR